MAEKAGPGRSWAHMGALRAPVSEKRRPRPPGHLEWGRRGTGDRLGLASEAGPFSGQAVAAQPWGRLFPSAGQQRGAGLLGSTSSPVVLIDASDFALMACLFNGEQLPPLGTPTKRSIVPVFAFCFPELMGAIFNSFVEPTTFAASPGQPTRPLRGRSADNQPQGETRTAL